MATSKPMTMTTPKEEPTDMLAPVTDEVIHQVEYEISLKRFAGGVLMNGKPCGYLDLLAACFSRIRHAATALAAKDKEIAKWKNLGQAILDNDPMSDAADGVSCLDVWRKDIRAALAAKET